MYINTFFLSQLNQLKSLSNVSFFIYSSLSPVYIRLLIHQQWPSSANGTSFLSIYTLTLKLQTYNVQSSPTINTLQPPLTYLAFMALIPSFFFFLLLLCLVNSQPSPGYYPSTKLSPLRFYEGYNSLWEPQHQTVSQDQSSITIWLDQYSGSGFKSKTPYSSGYFAVSVKLQSGYTAGVNTAFYLSNNEAHPGYHDEVDIEFLGTIPGKPYTLQTNVYVMGSGDGRIIGREMRFHLWFDPTADFHNYAILWNDEEIIFFVDDIPIRRYARTNDATFPRRPMWAYGSIWDASSWATENGKYKADYKYQPFIARMTKFLIGGCSDYAAASCQPPPASPAGRGLSGMQYMAMRWAQQNHMVYDYCRDSSRDHSLTPEC